MQDIKTDLIELFDRSLKSMEEYDSRLISLAREESKKQISEYYKFCSKLTDMLALLDTFTMGVSLQVHTCDAHNEHDKVTSFSALFEQAIALRRIAEEFLLETESLIQASQNSLSIDLKKQTDIAIRKISLLKSRI